MQSTIAQLHSEVYQCHLLLQAASERLAHITAALQQLEVAAGHPPTQPLWPAAAATKDYPYKLSDHQCGDNSLGIELSNNTSSDNLPKSKMSNHLSADNLQMNGLSNHQCGDNLFKNGLSLTSAATNLPTVRGLSRVLKTQEYGKTTLRHIERTAQLMLFIRQHPGEQFGIKDYARVLSMGHGGTGRFLFLIRERGLIKRTGYRVHALTAKSEAYLQEALKPVILE
jgi:hypothetical protein